jgi:hypothetical protein
VTVPQCHRAVTAPQSQISSLSNTLSSATAPDDTQDLSRTAALRLRHERTTSQGVACPSGPRARPQWARVRRCSVVAPNPSRCRIAGNQLPEDPRQNFREAVSDRGSGVRSRGETPTRAPRDRGIPIMKLTTMTQVTVDGVMQGNGPMDVDGGNGFRARRLGHGGACCSPTAAWTSRLTWSTREPTRRA